MRLVVHSAGDDWVEPTTVPDAAAQVRWTTKTIYKKRANQMPRSIILGIVILLASLCGHAGYRFSGGRHFATGISAGIGAMAAVVIMRLLRIF